MEHSCGRQAAPSPVQGQGAVEKACETAVRGRENGGQDIRNVTKQTSRLVAGVKGGEEGIGGNLEILTWRKLRRTVG